MEHKEDIGKMVEKTMEHGIKSPKASLWERLDQSLTAREKKRRRAIWFWYTGAGILVFLLLGVWGFSNNTIQKSTVVPVSSSEIVTNEANTIVDDEALNTSPISEADGIAGGETQQITTEKNENTKEITTKKDPVTTNKTEGTAPPKSISEVHEKTDTMANGDFTVTTKHAYYNSDINTTVVSTNKREIDSLVIVNMQKMAIKDSIARARATDSIKLNEVKKDSIRK